jgi:hypothetical protein
MPFRFPGLPQAIIQGNLAAQSSKENVPPAFNQGSAAAAKVAASDWVKGAESQRPQVTSAPAWFTGRQPFSELRTANEDVFKAWGDRFSNATNAGFEFRPPPPEPDDTMAASGTSPAGGQQSAQAKKSPSAGETA